jgi:hypothetical protein
MPRRISIEPHLSIDELENRYRQSKDAIASGGAKPIARTHYQTIWLLASGKTTSEELVRSYNRFGPQMLGDRRKNNTGAEPLLNDVQLAQLWQVLQSKPGDGGLWNGPLICGMDE